MGDYQSLPVVLWLATTHGRLPIASRCGRFLALCSNRVMRDLNGVTLRTPNEVYVAPCATLVPFCSIPLKRAAITVLVALVPLAL